MLLSCMHRRFPSLAPLSEYNIGPALPTYASAYLFIYRLSGCYRQYNFFTVAFTIYSCVCNMCLRHPTVVLRSMDDVFKNREFPEIMFIAAFPLRASVARHFTTTAVRSGMGGWVGWGGSVRLQDGEKTREWPSSPPPLQGRRKESVACNLAPLIRCLRDAKQSNGDCKRRTGPEAQSRNPCRR